jgi:hypothetical protein
MAQQSSRSIKAMKNKRSLITVDLTGCKNWNGCMKVIDMITLGKVKLTTKQIK